MSELDIKALKRQIPEARQKHMVDSFGNAVEGMVLLSADQAEAIIAALEDRERLRALVSLQDDILRAYRFHEQPKESTLDRIREVRAALEGSDG